MGLPLKKQKAKPWGSAFVRLYREFGTENLRFIGFIHSEERPLLGRAIGEMNQRARFVFGQVVNPGFHDRPAFTDGAPSGSLAFLVDGSLYLK